MTTIEIKHGDIVLQVPGQNIFALSLCKEKHVFSVEYRLYSIFILRYNVSLDIK